MPLAHDRCICLRKVEYSETSQILTLFGREFGRLQLIAKGAHRRTKAGASKFDGGIDLLDLGDAVFSHAPERELPPLTEWHLLEGHQALRKNLRAIYLAQYAAELINFLIEDHDPHVELFDRLEQLLGDLGTAKLEESFLVFELDLLRETGYLPELNACVMCGLAVDERERHFFSPSRGGLACRNCEGVAVDRLEIDARLVRLLRQILQLPRIDGVPTRLPRLTRHQTDPLNRLLADHVQHVLQRRMRLVRYISRPPQFADRAPSKSSLTPNA